MTLAADPSAPSRSPGAPLLFPAEGWLAAATASLVPASLALAALRGQAVDWAGFLPGLAPGAALVAIGLLARARGSMDRLSLFLVASGIFIGFLAASSVFTFLLFPLPRPTVDAQLAAIDAWLGYDWPALVGWLAERPGLSRLLRAVYLSSIWQMFGVIVTLALLRRRADLHRFLAVGIAGLGITVAIWWLWPSVGPSAGAPLDPGIAARASLLVDSRVGAELMRMVRDGNPVITPGIITGVVAFPSFHMMMACMAVWYLRRTPLFWPALAVNALMVPATLAHGAHHLVDLIGAAALFGLLAPVAARRIGPREA